MTASDLRLTQTLTPSGLPAVHLGEPCLDAYLDFLTARCRPNTVLAAGYDLKVFFTLIAKPATEVRPGDILAFITAQRAGVSTVVGPVMVPDPDSSTAISARTLRRRLSSINGFFAYLHACETITTNPMPRGLTTRRERDRGSRAHP